MRANAFIKHKSSGELYKYTTKQVGQNTEESYYYVGNVFITAGMDKFGNMTISSDTNIPASSVIKNIKDIDGNLILDDTAWLINITTPSVDSFNSVSGYLSYASEFTGTL